MATSSKTEVKTPVIGNRNCCVPTCRSVYKKNKHLMFHVFPKHGQTVNIENNFGENEECDRRKVWQIKLRIGKKISQAMRVCSLHFKPVDYECSGWSTRKRLKETAVPSQNLPVEYKFKTNSSTKAPQGPQNSQLQEKNEVDEDKNMNLMDIHENENCNNLIDVIEAAHALLLLAKSEGKSERKRIVINQLKSVH